MHILNYCSKFKSKIITNSLKRIVSAAPSEFSRYVENSEAINHNCKDFEQNLAMLKASTSLELIL
ncbi:hypothetical protein Mgra_00009254 [Meloidogyne graminicola]|uniref:Uncharacterized protein n=1 Tax=Meloidogyne graminicola TaxID=189291 RepID=A0A8S9ZDI5_9BILA|nr:hypothetical protein Mgra_00009254 [Meloidogyne graminicola]